MTATRHLNRHLVRPARAIGAACGLALAAGVLATGTASAGGTGGGGGVGDQTGGSAENGTIKVEVSVSGTAVGNGGTTRSGGAGGGGVQSVYTPPACYWDSLDGAYTGDSMWQMYQDTPQRWGVGSEANYLPSIEEVEAHKGKDGVWYTIAPGPNSNIEQGENSGISWDDVTQDCMTNMRRAAGPGANGGNAGYYFVPTGGAPPAPQPAPPTPEQMRDAALDALTLPVPDMGVNPTGRTLVDIPTWFWVPAGDFRLWDVTATAAWPGAFNVSATVTATPQSFSVVSAGGASGPCAPGTATNAWGTGKADISGCTVDFVRSSYTQPGQAYDVDGTTIYQAAWTSTVNGAAGPGGALAAQDRTGEAAVPVAESQALVTGTR